MRRSLVVLLLLAGLNLVPTTAAVAGAEPRLSVSAAQAAGRLHCTGNLATSARKPVLLLHGTTSSAKANWSWNWDKALDARHWAHCDLDLPANGNNDIQVAAEYVVRAIKLMHQRAGRKISIVGHSQGGMIARWSLEWWPLTRAMVDDYVGLAPSNRGTRRPCSSAGRWAAAPPPTSPTWLSRTSARPRSSTTSGWPTTTPPG